MSEAAVSSLLKGAFDGLSSVILDELKDLGLGGHPKDREKLESNLSDILAALREAEMQPGDTMVKQWMGKVKELAYDVEVILDECTTEARRRKSEVQGPPAKKTCLFVDSNAVAFRLRMSGKIKEIRERLEMVAKTLSKLLDEDNERLMIAKTLSRLLDEDKERLVWQLLDVGKEGVVSIVPIVGRTKFPLLAYNDARVEKHFDIRTWVSQADYCHFGRLAKAILRAAATHSKDDFRLKKLTSAIFNTVPDANCDFEKVDLIRCGLQEHLKGKKVLIVLDDVMDENVDCLFRFESLLSVPVTVCKIIVITRSIRVRSIMSTRFLFHPSPSDYHQEQKEEKRISSGLWSSYYHLSSKLKRCLAYCSVFPKLHQIKIEELVLLWMAEGLIRPTQGADPIEDVGEGSFYFDVLLSESFFQEPEKDEHGRIISCKMNDLGHDLAHSVSGDAHSLDIKEGKLTSIPNGCHHLSLWCSSYHDGPVTEWMASNRAEKLRTLLAFTSRVSLPSHNLSIHFPCLRVLDLSYLDVTKDTLDSISRLKHLRYLHLARLQILPESFSNLRYLQTLRLTDCRDLELPREMHRMISLRHLEVTPPSCLAHMPATLRELKFLQTMSVFVVGKESRGDDIRELGYLNLGGELNIQKLENVGGKRNAREAKLCEKEKLRKLTFSWSNVINANMRSSIEQTLEGLQPHPNLKSLTVENYWGESFPHWMCTSLCYNLTHLSLSNCKRCEQLPSLGQLLSLRFLHIAGMDALRYIDSHFCGDRAFPSLKDLIFQDMPNLEEWSEFKPNHAFLCLERLKVMRCPKLIQIPRFPSLQSLTKVNFGADTLQEMWIEGSVTLKPFRRQGYTSLNILIAQQRHNLVSIIGEMDNLSALESLFTDMCPELGSLASLTSLSIGNCHKAKHLPEVLKYAPVLQDLHINNLRTLIVLPNWIGNLSSLQSIEIRYCPNLLYLPSALGSLTNLQSLTIEDCPQLEKRCQAMAGEDWHKIAHIPNIQIGRLLV